MTPTKDKKHSDLSVTFFLRKHSLFGLRNAQVTEFSFQVRVMLLSCLCILLGIWGPSERPGVGGESTAP